MPSSAQYYQHRSLNNIKCLSKKTFLKGYKYYRLVKTFVRSFHRALTVRPFHQALTMINIDHYINKLDEACHIALTMINMDYLNKYNTSCLSTTTLKGYTLPLRPTD